jgi:hypothetical protein
MLCAAWVYRVVITPEFFMVSEESIIDRERVECIVRELSEMLKVGSYFQFKLRFSKSDNGEETLTIIPHATPVEITLRRS